MRLPAIDKQRKWPAFAAGYVGFCALYIFTGRVHWRAPAPLPPWAIDRMIPFIDWTVWIYHTQFFFLLFAVWAIRQTVNLSRTLYAMAMASAVSFVVFFVYPTTLPRAAMASDVVTARAFEFLYRVDPATNCLPSLHVALAALAAFGVASESKRLGSAAILWAGLIGLSTLTTRQHYFIDVLAGLCVAGVSRLCAGRLSFAAPSLAVTGD
jgi:membrane-associated phospholipid phosphatase